MSYLAIYQQRRRNNLKRLLADYPTQRHFADAVGLSVAQVSHLLTGFREMGEEIARRIEEALKLEMGWMDRDADASLSDAVRGADGGYRVNSPTGRSKRGPAR